MKYGFVKRVKCKIFHKFQILHRSRPSKKSEFYEIFCQVQIFEIIVILEISQGKYGICKIFSKIKIFETATVQSPVQPSQDPIAGYWDNEIAVLTVDTPSDHITIPMQFNATSRIQQFCSQFYWPRFSQVEYC